MVCKIISCNADVEDRIGASLHTKKAPHTLTSVNTNKYIYKHWSEGNMWCYKLNPSITDWQGSVLISTAERYTTVQWQIYCTVVQNTFYWNKNDNKKEKNHKKGFCRKHWDIFFFVCDWTESKSLQQVNKSLETPEAQVNKYDSGRWACFMLQPPRHGTERRFLGGCVIEVLPHVESISGRSVSFLIISILAYILSIWV